MCCYLARFPTSSSKWIGEPVLVATSLCFDHFSNVRCHPWLSATQRIQGREAQARRGKWGKKRIPMLLQSPTQSSSSPCCLVRPDPWQSGWTPLGSCAIGRSFESLFLMAPSRSPTSPPWRLWSSWAWTLKPFAPTIRPTTQPPLVQGHLKKGPMSYQW